MVSLRKEELGVSKRRKRGSEGQTEDSHLLAWLIEKWCIKVSSPVSPSLLDELG